MNKKSIKSAIIGTTIGAALQAAVLIPLQIFL